MVTERICRIPQSDLITIRLTCKACQRTAEGTVDEGYYLHDQGKCKLCGSSLGIFTGPRDDKHDPLAQLELAWRRLKELESKFVLEFVIPADGDGGK